MKKWGKGASRKLRNNFNEAAYVQHHQKEMMIFGKKEIKKIKIDYSIGKIQISW